MTSIVGAAVTVHQFFCILHSSCVPVVFIPLSEDITDSASYVSSFFTKLIYVWGGTFDLQIVLLL